MNTLQSFRSKEFVDFCSGELKEYAQNYRGVEMALLATPDGFEIADFTTSSIHGADKLAAVGSSLFALGASLVNEFNLKNCKSVILDSEKGKVYISEISNMNTSIILMVQTNEQATLGNIIHGAKRLNNRVGAQLHSIGK